MNEIIISLSITILLFLIVFLDNKVNNEILVRNPL